MTHNEALDPIVDAAHAAPCEAGGQVERAARDGLSAAPATPSHRTQHEAEARDELLASLGRRFRGATLKLEFELRTAIARQIFQRDFVYISQQLHALEASRRVQGIERQVLKDALAAVARRGDAVRTVLLMCAAEARALIAAHGHAEADVAFERPARLQATIVSPHARDFLDILGNADDALTQVEKAWLLGLLEPAEKARRASECRRVLHGFKEIVRQQRHVVGLHVREVNAARQRPARPDPPDNPRTGDPTRRSGAADAALDLARDAHERGGPGAQSSRFQAADGADDESQPGSDAFRPAEDAAPTGAIARPLAAPQADGSAHA